MSRLVPGRPSARAVRRSGLGLVVGLVGGWLAGLLRAPRERSSDKVSGAR